MRQAIMTFLIFAALANTAPAEDLVDAVENKQWQKVEKLLDSSAEVNQSQPGGMTAMHWAVFHNQVSTVKKLIRADSKCDVQTEYGVSPASIACEYGYNDCLAFLLEAEIDPNKSYPGGESLLLKAARQGSLENVNLLLKAKAKVDHHEIKGQTALMWAAAKGHDKVVQTLIDAGADPKAELKSGFTPLFFASRNGHTKVVKLLYNAGVDISETIDARNSSGRNPRKRMSALLFAVESGHFELAIELVKLGADPNDQRSGFAPLHALSWVRRPKWGDGVDGDPPPRGSGEMTSLEFVEKIVELGADPKLELKNGRGGRAVLNPKGATPFLYAARTVDIPYMKLLLKLGSDPLKPNADGCTPLMAVAGVGVRAVNEEPGTEEEVIAAIKWLVTLGADVNTVDENLETAMHGSAYRSYPKVATTLAEMGANPSKWNHKNKAGWTPFRIAEGYRPGSFKPSPEMQAAIKQAMRVKNTPVEN